MDLQCHKIVYSLIFLLLYMMRVGLFMYPEQRIKALCVSLICPPIIMRRKLSSNKLPQAHTQATPFKKCTGRQTEREGERLQNSLLLRHPQASQKALHRERLLSWRKQNTTLQSMMNAKLSKQRFYPCHENRLIKTIQTIPHNLYVSVKLTSLYRGLRLILVYPNPQ